MKKTTDPPAPAQAGNEEFRDLFQGAVRGMVREGLLQMIKDEVQLLCGDSYRPQGGSLYRRAGTEPVRIRTSEGPEFIDKRRVRRRQPDGLEQEVRLKSYAEIKRRKGMFDEVLEAICHGASGRGVGQLLGVSASQVCAGWKARSRELLAEFRERDSAPLAVLALMVDGVFLGRERCVVVALAVDAEGHKHLLDFEEGSSESAAVVMALFAKLKALGIARLSGPLGPDIAVAVQRHTGNPHQAATADKGFGPVGFPTARNHGEQAAARGPGAQGGARPNPRSEGPTGCRSCNGHRRWCEPPSRCLRRATWQCRSASRPDARAADKRPGTRRSFPWPGFSDVPPA